MRDINAPLPETDFWRAYAGRLNGLLKWEDFDAFFDKLTASGGDWYVFDPAGSAPDAPAGNIDTAISEARACVEQVRGRSFCGAVFTDDFENPSFVKVFDPYKMGGLCGGPGNRILPRWIFSRLKPDALPCLPEEPEKTGLFARLLG